MYLKNQYLSLKLNSIIIKNNEFIEMKGNDVFKVGCLGRISDFQKIKDGRILINLTGVSRFEIIEEVNNKKLYRFI